MKLFVRTVLTVFVICGLAFSQEERPKAAVCVAGKARDRAALRMLVNDFLIRSGRYQVIPIDAVDAAAKERKIRPRANLSDAAAAKLGSAAGAEVIFVVRQMRRGEGSIISVRVVGVESGTAELSAAAELSAGGKIVDVVQEMMEAALARRATGTGARPVSAPSGSGAGRQDAAMTPPPGFRASAPEIVMVPVEGGTFAMGCTPEQGRDCDGDERPVRNVTLSDFSIGKFEITQAQWKLVMGINPSQNQGDNLPVEHVNWNEAQAFIAKLNELTGKNYRLPTEAEWEYAARGGKNGGGFKYSGSNDPDEVAWHKDNSGGKTNPVGGKRPNELGIHDMSGNVEEWVGDWYGEYGDNDQTNPTGASSGTSRSYRGGGWKFGAKYARVSYRDLNRPSEREDVIGFRIVLPSGNPPPDPVTPPHRSSVPAGFQGEAPEIEMILVEGGTFKMGCTPEQGGDCEDREKPAHDVTVGNFLIGKHEITQKQWTMVMGSNPTSSSGDRGDDRPVVDVSWNDVREFITRLNELSGKQYRLPTEAEWEFAARGGKRSGGFKYAGSNNIDEVAWYEDNSNNKVHPVGTKKPNELGIHDMSGNAREWVGDWFGDYTQGAKTNPAGPSEGTRRILRGGDHLDTPDECRVASRGPSRAGDSYSYYGFRVALNP